LSHPTSSIVLEMAIFGKWPAIVHNIYIALHSSNACPMSQIRRLRLREMTIPG
jgi:hypothetical protein